MEIIEKPDAWRRRYNEWLDAGERPRPTGIEEIGTDYPFVENRRASFKPARSALSMLNLALISSAGAYIDGTEPFNAQASGGDTTFREIPAEIEAGDLKYVTRGYHPQAVLADMNAQIPLQRLFEFEGNGIIGQLNSAFWSICGFIPDATRVAEELAPRLVERVTRYEVQAALLIPASRLCHQSLALVARALETAGVPTMMIAVDKAAVESVRPPRAGLYNGQFGSVAGRPNWPEHQRRVLDESLRLLEPLDQVVVRRLTVDLETEVETQRGEK